MSTTITRRLNSTAARPGASLRRLALCGRLAGPMFLGAILVLDWLDPNVTSLADPISYLAARSAPYAPLMNVILGISGLLFTAGTLALHHVLPPLPRGRPVLTISWFGLVGMLGAAVLPCDFHCYTGSLAGKLHFLPAILGWGLLHIGLWRLPVSLSRDSRWAAHAAWPLRLVVASLALTVLFHLGGLRWVPGLHGYIGFFQRLFLLCVFGALYAMAGHLRRLESS